MKETIKKQLREALGVQSSIKTISELISDDIKNQFYKLLDKINDGNTWELVSQIRPSNEIKDDTKIDLVTTRIDFMFSDEFKIGGSFKPNKTVSLDDGNYTVIIELILNTNNIETALPYIEGAVSHELNHAFAHIKKINKITKSGVLNQAKNKTNREIDVLINTNPPLKEFMRMFYLALPDEVNARVQQTGSELRHIDSSDYNETLEALQQFKPISQARNMINYNSDSVKSINQDILTQFISTFNSSIKAYSLDKNNIKMINNPDDFFKYWGDVIRSTGSQSLKKILSLVANKHNITEDRIWHIIDYHLLDKVSGRDLMED